MIDIYIYIQPRKDLDPCGYSFARYSPKYIEHLYGDAMLVPIRDTNMAITADGIYSGCFCVNIFSSSCRFEATSSV